MDIHRKLRVLEQQAKVRVLEQRRRRAGRVRQLRVLEQRAKVRLLEQWADGRARQLRVLAHTTKLRVLEQRAKLATPTATPPSGRGYHALTWRSHGHSLAA